MAAALRSSQKAVRQRLGQAVVLVAAAAKLTTLERFFEGNTFVLPFLHLMAPRYYSIEEVNAVLPEISDLLGELLERRGRVVTQRRELTDVVQDRYSNVGNATASSVVQDFIRIEQLLDKVKSYGCEVKDLNAGLIDFLSRVDGREVYLCWRYGEDLSIEHYHDLNAGFSGRRKISENDDLWTESC
ncbi:MAG: DUF2203 domain-containing protein [Candidatus Promineifilaceae bacterium]